MYHIVAISVRTGARTYMTSSPVTHAEACTMLSKLTVHRCRKLQLEIAG